MNKIKVYAVKVFAVLLILVLIFSPYLLILDFKGYAPLVLFIWVSSVAYYIFILRKKQDRDREEQSQAEGDRP